MSQSLQTLLEGIYSSVLEARRFVNLQHLKLFQSYFDTKVVEDPETGQKLEVYTPRMVALTTTKEKKSNGEFDIIEAPALTLVPLSTLSIETLEIEFEAKLTNLTMVEKEKPKPVRKTAKQKREEKDIITRTIDDLFGTSAEIEIMSKGDSFESSTSPAKVKVMFKMSEPPEGVNLIQEQLLDNLRS